MSDTKNGQERQEEALHSSNHIPKTLVVVGTETAIFDVSSPVRRRILESVRSFREVHIIVLCRGDFEEEKVDEHIYLYPTNSSSRIGRVFDAVRIGRSLRRADVVTVQDPFETGLVGLYVARFFRAAFHVQVHTDFLSPAYARHSLLNHARVHIAHFVLSRADGVRVVSERIRNSLLASRWSLKNAPKILPIFVDVQRFRLPPKENSLRSRFALFMLRVLIVSRLEREKNVALGISAFASAAPNNACLIIVGGGSEEGSLQRVARQKNIVERVFFEGKHDPASYYAIADLVLFPSKYDGYGMVIVEALAAGKPVLSTDVGVARESGAIITSEERYADALKEWFGHGSRSAELKNYPYNNFEDYVRAYQDDLAACVRYQKTQ